MACLFKIALAQMCSGVLAEQNLTQLAAFAAKASDEGAHYLLTPEMSVAFSENHGQLKQASQGFENNDALDALAKIAQKNSLFLHVGSMAIALPDGRFANRSVLFDPDGKIVDFYDKIHLFDADVAGDDTYRESDNYRGGKRAVLTQMGNINIGMSICYDMRFGALYKKLAKAGAHMICVPAAFTVPTGKAHWEVLLRARAIETGCYILAAAQGGVHENGRETYGHSMVIDPWGEVVNERGDQSQGLIFAELDFEKVKTARKAIPALMNEAEFCLSVNHVAL